MKIAVFSDIHGNLEALKAVLADAKERGYDRLVCLGDVVGYGADPEECVEVIRREVFVDGSGESVVKGNHDDAVAGGDDSYFNPDAKRAVGWTREHLSEGSLQWLSALPYEKRHSGILLVHASPFDPGEWNYVVTMSEAWNAFESFGERIAFIGHSHVPFTVGIDSAQSSLHVETHEHVILKPGWRYLTNVGSVGQPRDGDPRASYVQYDDEEMTLDRIRVEYDIDAAASKIHEAGLPAFLADRLFKGR